VALARHLFFGALPILGDVPEVRGDIVNDEQCRIRSMIVQIIRALISIAIDYNLPRFKASAQSFC
ncbi:MAG: hypothetical protein KAS66_15955, partial [Candidatus Omnitrophica bacterium]|nr:hypothetical protein [Candidatus Omnitrophota bacterium]